MRRVDGRYVGLGWAWVTLASACSSSGDRAPQPNSGSTSAEDAAVVKPDGALGDDAALADLDSQVGSERDGASLTDGAAHPLDAAKMDDAGLPMMGESLFGSAPFTAPAKPVHLLALGKTSGLCVVLEDRSVYCEGSNAGNPPDLATRAASARSITFDGFADVDDYTLLRADGSTHAWGYFTADDSAFALAGSGYIDALSLRSDYCALNAQGALSCAGGARPTLPTGPFVSFALSDAGGEAFVGLRSDGAVLLSSDGKHGAIDDLRFRSFSAEEPTRGCGEDTQGTLHCFSLSDRVQEHWPQPYSQVLDYALGIGHVCVVQADGEVACRQFDGRASRAAVPSGKQFVDVETYGPTRSCGITVDGQVWCWTDNAAQTVQIALPKKAATH